MDNVRASARLERRIQHSVVLGAFGRTEVDFDIRILLVERRDDLIVDFLIIRSPAAHGQLNLLARCGCRTGGCAFRCGGIPARIAAAASQRDRSQEH
ncbi:hypothetical protein D3C71_1509570 [compost metagenome]